MMILTRVHLSRFIEKYWVYALPIIAVIIIGGGGDEAAPAAAGAAAK